MGNHIHIQGHVRFSAETTGIDKQHSHSLAPVTWICAAHPRGFISRLIVIHSAFMRSPLLHFPYDFCISLWIGFFYFQRTSLKANDLVSQRSRKCLVLLRLRGHTSARAVSGWFLAEDALWWMTHGCDVHVPVPSSSSSSCLQQLRSLTAVLLMSCTSTSTRTRRGNWWVSSNEGNLCYKPRQKIIHSVFILYCFATCKIEKLTHAIRLMFNWHTHNVCVCTWVRE